MNFPLHLNRNKRADQGFAIVEALVAAGISAVVLTGSIAILNRQIEFAANGRALAEARNVINQDIKAIRQYASLWSMENNIFDDTKLAGQEFPDAMTFISSPACRAWSRRGSLETFARSDSPTTYSRWFPYVTQIWQNNATVSSIPVTGSIVYEVQRRYVPNTTTSSQVGTTSTARDDEIPYTLRITYTVRSVENKADGSVSRTNLPIEQTADINFVAQYSC
jgi:type II secretory pathway pseudopilin PulG